MITFRASCVRLWFALFAGAVLGCTVLAQTAAAGGDRHAYPWQPDNGDGTYTNPVIHADYSDPDVIRVGKTYVMVSSSFAHTPGLPVLTSTDLVNWTIVGHVAENLPSPMFDTPQHGKGIWAPSIRYHGGEFYVYYGDPDLGIFMAKAKRAEGPWEAPVLVREAKGWIDPCPLWDEDGSAYLVHGWAKSRAGINSILTVNRMNAAGTKILDDGVMVFDGHRDHPTIEGPKFYRRNGYYYIFAPAGGVKPGWQTVLRSKQLYGPYEARVVLAQGATRVNGPHQGAWIDTPAGDDWFIHFQDKDAYGRIVHLQPMIWKNDWPVIGTDRDGRGCGEPVRSHAKPGSAMRSPAVMPQTNDEFDSPVLGLQWQWEANHMQWWYSLSATSGALRLFSVPLSEGGVNLWDAPNLLLQKFPAETFTATTLIDGSTLAAGDRAGLVVFGMNYAVLSVRRDSLGAVIEQIACVDAQKHGTETSEAAVRTGAARVYLRVQTDTGAVCQFSYSSDGAAFAPIGKKFTARAGLWVGAKVGLVAGRAAGPRTTGYADVHWFRFE